MNLNVIYKKAAINNSILVRLTKPNMKPHFTASPDFFGGATEDLVGLSREPVAAKGRVSPKSRRQMPGPASTANSKKPS